MKTSFTFNDWLEANVPVELRAESLAIFADDKPMLDYLHGAYSFGLQFERQRHTEEIEKLVAQIAGLKLALQDKVELHQRRTIIFPCWKKKRK